MQKMQPNRPETSLMCNFHSQNSLAMLQNYLLTAIRNIYRNRMSSLINIIGLSLAIGCSLVTYVFWELQLTQDNFHTKADRVFLITSTVKGGDGSIWRGDTPIPIAPRIKDISPSVIASSRIDFYPAPVKYKDEVFNESLGFVDSDFFDMFDFKLKWGNTLNFNEGSSIIISEDISEKYFGDDNPLGEQVTVLFGEDRKLSFTIGGVFDKIPRTASFYVPIAVPFNYLKMAHPDYAKFDENDWERNIAASFVELKSPEDVRQVQELLNEFTEEQNKANVDWPANEFPLQVLETLSLHSEEIQRDISGGSDKSGRMALVVVAVFLLLLASFNYINMSVAAGTRRLKEIGIRKVLGGARINLIFQFILENILLVSLALFLGLLWAAVIFVPGFKSLFPVPLEVDFTSLYLWIYSFVMILIIGVLSGAYPAFYISNFKPIAIFRGRLKASKNRFTKIFLTVQFILGIICISGGIAFIMNSNYQKTRDWGYNIHHVVVVPLRDSYDFEDFSNDLRQNPNIIAIGASANHIGESVPRAVIDVGTEKKDLRKLDIGEGYEDVMKFRLKEGRMLNWESAEDRQEYVVVNETFIKELGIADPYEFTFRFDSSTYHIAGVVEDFHYYNFYTEIEPVFIRMVEPDYYNYISILTTAEKSSEINTYAENKWKELYPDNPYSGYLQAEINNWYFENLSGHGKLMSFIALLSIFLSCMGLFGLVSQKVTFRIKEFSIRKVLGAEAINLTKVMNREYAIILLISIIIGTPLAFWLIDSFMGSVYPYRMPSSVMPYIAGSIIMSLTAIFTISSLIVKVLKANPVDVLRNE